MNLATGRDHQLFRITLPVTGEEVHVTFSRKACTRLKDGLQGRSRRAATSTGRRSSDPNRPPYRGLRPLEAEDAGIFFGREAPDHRGDRPAARAARGGAAAAAGDPRRVRRRQVVLPARRPAAAAGPRSADFLPLPVIRPERAAI